MDRQFASLYAPLLERHLPTFTGWVNEPWDQVPDLVGYHGRAFRQIGRALNRLHRDGRRKPVSKGVLVLGEAGAGKTHLLMRVAQRLGDRNFICFVRRPNNEEAVAQHIWANAIDSLSRSTEGRLGGASQLDELLSHVFATVLVGEFEKDVREGQRAKLKQRWVKQLREDPWSIFNLLGNGEDRLNQLRAVRNRVLRYMQLHHPQVDQRIAYALLTYCLTAQEHRRRSMRTWLAGGEIDSKEAQGLGLPASWIDDDNSSSDLTMRQQREDQALRALQTLGILSTYHRPIILAFDQLEWLRGQQPLTTAWGDVMREIFTMTPNLLVVTCVFPSHWDNWFAQRLDGSAAQRIAEHRVELEPLDPKHARALLEKHLESTTRTLELPTPIYPFTEEDIQSCSADAPTPRAFLNRIRDAFDQWLEKHANDGPFAGEKDCQTDHLRRRDDIRRIYATKKIQHVDNRATWLQTNEDLFGRLRHVVATLLRDAHPVHVSVARDRYFVMPDNFVLHSQYGESLCVGLLNATGGSFTARMKHFATAMKEKEHFENAILLRSDQVKPPSKKGKEFLTRYRKAGGGFIEIDEEEHASINALYDTIVMIEESNPSQDADDLNLRDFLRFLAASELPQTCRFLRELLSRVDFIKDCLCEYSPDADDRVDRRSSKEPAGTCP